MIELLIGALVLLTLVLVAVHLVDRQQAEHDRRAGCRYGDDDRQR